MEIKASLNYLRIAPRKTRLVVDLIRNSSLEVAERQLQFLDKKATMPVLKLLRSAMANAKNNFNIEDKKLLIIKDIRVDEGPHNLKRWQPRAMGRAFPILKRSSHIELILEAKGVEEKKGKKTKIKNIMVKTTPKIVKNELKPTTQEAEKEIKDAEEKFEKYTDKGQVPEKPFNASGVIEKKAPGKQPLGSFKKRFFRRKNV